MGSKNKNATLSKLFSLPTLCHTKRHKMRCTMISMRPPARVPHDFEIAIAIRTRYFTICDLKIRRIIELICDCFSINPGIK